MEKLFVVYKANECGRLDRNLCNIKDLESLALVRRRLLKNRRLGDDLV